MWNINTYNDIDVPIYSILLTLFLPTYQLELINMDRISLNTGVNSVQLYAINEIIF